MKVTARFLAASALLCGVFTAAPATAQVAGVTVSNPNVFTDGDGPWTLGFSFTATQNLTVTALGAFDYLGNGFIDAHQVGIWDSNGTLLASTSLSSLNPLLNGFRYADIAGLSLASGNSYTIGASNFGVNDAYAYNSTITPSAGITYDSARYLHGAALINPITTGTSGGYFGANFLISSAVPEPGTWAMMLIGFGGMGVALRRGRKPTAVAQFA
jgi:hypothetical protein